MNDLTHSDLCAIGVRLLKNRFRCCWAVTELVTYCQESPDVFGARSCGQETYVLEAKVSRSDFLADRKKPFRINPELGIGMFRYYIAPVGLIDVNELPDKWGLIEADGKRANVVAGKPPKKHPGAYPDLAHEKRNIWGEVAIAHSVIRRMVGGEDISKYI